MQVEGSVNQAESSEFRVGQVAKIKFDAFPGMEFNGKVYSIGALAAGGLRSASAYIRNVPIRVKIEGSDPRLIPDLSASADVVIEKARRQQRYWFLEAAVQVRTEDRCLRESRRYIREA